MRVGWRKLQHKSTQNSRVLAWNSRDRESQGGIIGRGGTVDLGEEEGRKDISVAVPKFSLNSASLLELADKISLRVRRQQHLLK